MALPWMALIKAVPWTDVVAHAPAVLGAAKKLWQPPSGRRPSLPGEEGQGSGDSNGQRSGAGAGAGAGVSALRVAALETQVADLAEQLAHTNQLVQDMAEQQVRMLAQVEANRQALRLLRWLTAVAVVALVLATVATFKLFLV
jgi:hypothetical protein